MVCLLLCNTSWHFWYAISVVVFSKKIHHFHPWAGGYQRYCTVKHLVLVIDNNSLCKWFPLLIRKTVPCAVGVFTRWGHFNLTWLLNYTVMMLVSLKKEKCTQHDFCLTWGTKSLVCAAIGFTWVGFCCWVVSLSGSYCSYIRFLPPNTDVYKLIITTHIF